MTLEEFQIWFDGFKDGLECKGDTTVTVKQWATIKMKIASIKNPLVVPMFNPYEQYIKPSYPPYIPTADDWKYNSKVLGGTLKSIDSKIETATDVVEEQLKEAKEKYLRDMIQSSAVKRAIERSKQIQW